MIWIIAFVLLLSPAYAAMLGTNTTFGGNSNPSSICTNYSQNFIVGGLMPDATTICNPFNGANWTQTITSGTASILRSTTQVNLTNSVEEGDDIIDAFVSSGKEMNQIGLGTMCDVTVWSKEATPTSIGLVVYRPSDLTGEHPCGNAGAADVRCAGLLGGGGNANKIWVRSSNAAWQNTPTPTYIQVNLSINFTSLNNIRVYINNTNTFVENTGSLSATLYNLSFMRYDSTGTAVFENLRCYNGTTGAPQVAVAPPPDIAPPRIDCLNLTSEGGNGQYFYCDSSGIDNRETNVPRTNDTTFTTITNASESATWHIINNETREVQDCGTGQKVTCTWGGVPFTIGVHNITFNATDSSGNTNITQAKVNITDPTSTNVFFISNATYYKEEVNNTFNVYLNATDNYDGVFNLTVALNGATNYTNNTYANGSRVTLGMNELLPGTYNFSALTIDRQNNMNRTDFVVTVVSPDIVANATLYLNGQTKSMEYEYPHIYKNVSSGREYMVARIVIINATTNITDLESCIYIDGKNVSCGNGNWTYYFNVTALKNTLLNGSVEFVNITGPGIGNVSLIIDNRTDLVSVTLNITGHLRNGGYPIDTEIDVDRNGNFEIVLPGRLQNDILVQDYFSSAGMYGNESTVLLPTGGIVLLQINGSSRGTIVNLTFLVGGISRDTGNELDYRENFSQSSTMNATLSYNASSPGIFDGFETNVSGRWYVTSVSGDAVDHNLIFRKEGYVEDLLEFHIGTNAQAWLDYTDGMADLRNTSIANFMVNVYAVNTFNLLITLTDGTNDIQFFSAAGNEVHMCDTGCVWNLTIIKTDTGFDIYNNISRAFSQNEWGTIHVSDSFLDVNTPWKIRFGGGTGIGSITWQLYRMNWGGAWLKRYENNGTYVTTGNFTSRVVSVTKYNVSAITVSPSFYRPPGTNINFYVSNTCNNTIPIFESVIPEVLHIFSSVGNSICWRCELNSTINVTSPVCKNMRLQIQSGSIINISVDIGADGDIEWYFADVLNSTTSPREVNGSIADLTTYQAASCADIPKCSYPVTLSSATGGTLNISGLNFTMKISNIELNKTFLDNKIPINISYVAKQGILQVGRMVADFRGSRNFTINMTTVTNSTVPTAARDSRLVMFKYSKFNCTFPKNVLTYELLPNSNNQSNITIFGQQINYCSPSSDDFCVVTSTPIYNCTSYAYDDAIDLSLATNVSLDSSLNFSFDKGVNRTTALQVNSSTDINMTNALGQYNSTGFFGFVDFYNVSITLLQTLNFDWEWFAYCDGCVR